MFIYNVSVSVEASVESEWVGWMQLVHIPEVLSTGLFTECKFCKVLNRPDEDPMYCCQYFFRTMNDYNQYQNTFAPQLQQEHLAKYGDKCVAFRTLMEVI